MSNEDMNVIIRDVNAIMEIEDMRMTKQDKLNVQRVLNNEISGDDMIKDILLKYRLG